MIILDTNAVIYSVKQRIDIGKFSSEEITVPSSVVEELYGLSERDIDAKVALVAIKRYRILSVKERGDNGIIEAASKYGGKVITNDRVLRKSLREKEISVISMTKDGVRK